MNRVRPAFKCRYLLVSLQGAVTADMGNVDPSAVQRTGDKEKAVALPGTLFTAEHGHPETPSPFKEPLQAGLEQIRLRHPSIIDIASRIVELVSLGTASQFLPKEDVPDTHLLQAVSQVPTVELRAVPGIGRGPHIRNYLNPVLFQKSHQIIEGVIRVADRKERRVAMLSEYFTGDQRRLPHPEFTGDCGIWQVVRQACPVTPTWRRRPGDGRRRCGPCAWRPPGWRRREAWSPRTGDRRTPRSGAGG